MVRLLAAAAVVAALAWPVPAAFPLASPVAVRAPGDDGWVTVKSDSENVSLEVPPDFIHIEIKKPVRVLHIQYPTGDPWKRMEIHAYAHNIKYATVELWMKFVEDDAKGSSLAYVEGSTTRFTREFPGTENTTWIRFCEGKVDGPSSYYVEIRVLKDLFTAKRDELNRIMDSFRTQTPQDVFTVPPGWKKVQNDFYAVLGPVNDVKDPAEKKLLDDRLFRVSTWLDPQSPQVLMLREFAADKRKTISRSILHVYSNREAFTAAAGDAFREGAFAVYLPQHPEKPVVVDGSAESGITQNELIGVVAEQYLETRMPPLKPWVREAFRLYFDNAARRKNMLGLYTPEALKHVKEVFAKGPTPFEDLLGKDEAGMHELGDVGATSAWGYLYFGLHGADDKTRDTFNRFLKTLLGAGDCQATWDKALQGYFEVNKKKFKLKDVENGARKYWKDQKEEKPPK